MIKKIVISTLVLVTVFALVMTGLSLGNKTVLAADNDESELPEITEKADANIGFGRRGMDMHSMRRNAENPDNDGRPSLPEGVTRPCDIDGDGFPDLPEGISPRWNRDRERDPETAGQAFGYGKEDASGNGEGMHGIMRNARDRDGDVCPDCPQGVTPRWDRDRDGNPDVKTERPFRRTGSCPFAAETETP